MKKPQKPKKPRNMLKFVFQRVVLVSLCLLLQLGALAFGVFAASGISRIVSISLTLLSWVVILYIISESRAGDAYKLAWIIPILSLPVLGLLLYLLFGGRRLSASARSKLEALRRMARSELPQNPDTLAALEAESPAAGRSARYLLRTAGSPVYADCPTRYYAPVDEVWDDLIAVLEGAEHYIFLEFFIVAPGYLWDHILEILKRKAEAGVEVRLLYDDFGCIRYLPMHYAQDLRKSGIKAAAFNPYIPILSSRLNHRDHRKLLIADGRIAFTGGFNLADEYINRRERFGHWKDSALQIRGPAAWSMTVCFLTMWKQATGEDCAFNSYRPPMPEEEPEKGFVQPFVESPLDDEQIGENVYLAVIHSARHTLRIMTPYLVIDEALTRALTAAAKAGVEVQILTPGIPDKGFIQMLSRAYYGELTEAGVRIFEYSPGFLHSKVFLADDEVAVVGTINLDFRSLYLHYEDAVVLYGTESVADVSADFDQTLSRCEEFTDVRIRSIGFFTRLARAVLRLFAPLM